MKKQIEFTVKNYLDVHLELFKKINFIEIDIPPSRAYSPKSDPPDTHP